MEEQLQHKIDALTKTVNSTEQFLMALSTTDESISSISQNLNSEIENSSRGFPEDTVNDVPDTENIRSTDFFETAESKSVSAHGSSESSSSNAVYNPLSIHDHSFLRHLENQILSVSDQNRKLHRDHSDLRSEFSRYENDISAVVEEFNSHHEKEIRSLRTYLDSEISDYIKSKRLFIEESIGTTLEKTDEFITAINEKVSNFSNKIENHINESSENQEKFLQTMSENQNKTQISHEKCKQKQAMLENRCEANRFEIMDVQSRMDNFQRADELNQKLEILQRENEILKQQIHKAETQNESNNARITRIAEELARQQKLFTEFMVNNRQNTAYEHRSSKESQQSGYVSNSDSIPNQDSGCSISESQGYSSEDSFDYDFNNRLNQGSKRIKRIRLLPVL